MWAGVCNGQSGEGRVSGTGSGSRFERIDPLMNTCINFVD